MSEPSPNAHTFVFADLESSTRLWERFPDAMTVAMERHDAILQHSVKSAGGRVVKITGDGLMAVFPSPLEAVDASLAAQRSLHEEAWGETGPLRVRMGIHVGEAQERAGDFYGPPVNRTARLMSAGHGGQILLSGLAARAAERRLPAAATLRDLGEHRLKDLSEPEHVFQLVHPAIPCDFPPLATLSDRPNNLPTQMSEFLGRDVQLTAIRDLLEADGVRLLTLTGPGGIGKTRLALQSAANQIERFDDGVYLVDLAAARDEDAAFQAVVQTLGVSAKADQPPLELLQGHLRRRRLLLLLDNFEQVMGAADSLAELLRRCPDLKAIVTSREALRVRGEHLFPVPPLSLPPDGGAPLTAADVSSYEAVRLFAERAREVQPGFALTDENAGDVAHICARLDGLPLAIELAAARLTLFSVDELSGRLRSRLDVLRGGARDLPARQQTLRGVIEWSHELLQPDERAVFRLLSVFATARIEAIEDVAARVESLHAVDVVEQLASLVDKSLVHSVPTPAGRRLSMLETIREYAAERLDEDAGLGAAARQAHAEYFAGLAATQRGALSGAGREQALGELGAELGNLMAAWRHAVSARDGEQLNRLLDGLWALHDARGWYHAAVELANDLLGVLAAAPSTPDRVQEEIALQTSLARGLLAIRGYTEEVERTYNQALALSEQAGALPQRGPVLRSLASFYMYRGEFERSAAKGSDLLELGERNDDVGLQVEGRLMLGASLAFLGRIPDGLAHLERATALFDPQRHRAGRFGFGASPGAVAYTTSALLEWQRGHPQRSVELAESAVRVAHELDHPFTLAYALFHSSVLDFWRQELALVLERSTSVQQVAEEHGYPIWSALALVLRGVATTGLGRPEEGLAMTAQGVELYGGMTTPPVFWPLVLSVRARGFLLAGRPHDGLPLIDEAIELTGEAAFLYPDFALLKAELLLALDDAEPAKALLSKAITAGEPLGFRLPQLRAATMLVHVGRLKERPEALRTLRRVYDTFTEGLETRALRDARTALGEADVPVG
jgi:predicted ATPase/class 3 adenylate cyclase